MSMGMMKGVAGAFLGGVGIVLYDKTDCMR
jgi:hypothetical protein